MAIDLKVILGNNLLSRLPATTPRYGRQMESPTRPPAEFMAMGSRFSAACRSGVPENLLNRLLMPESYLNINSSIRIEMDELTVNQIEAVARYLESARDFQNLYENCELVHNPDSGHDWTRTTHTSGQKVVDRALTLVNSVLNKRALAASA